MKRSTSNMLRNLFSSKGAFESATCAGLAKDSNINCDTEFAEMVARLEVFEAVLKDTINKLSRHCQAICEVVNSSRELGGYLQNLHNEEQATAAETLTLLGTIASFETNSIAPLQRMLAELLQLKTRCNHRNSAKIIMQRYERKLAAIQSVTRHESLRLRRNRAKHQAAFARFQEIDSKLVTDVTAVLSNDLVKITDWAIEKLLVEHQTLLAHWMQAEVTGLQIRLEEYKVLAKDKKAHQQKTQTLMDDKRSNNADAAESSSANDMHSNNNVEITHVEYHAQNDKPSSLRCPIHTMMEANEPVPIMPDNVLNQEQSICPLRSLTSGSRTWNLHRHIKDSMASGLDLADCIQLPEGYQLDEWVAVHVIDFFNEISLLFGTISEFCTHSSCPLMSAGPCYTYLWADSVQQVAPISLPAADYVTRLLGWVEKQLDDPNLFPDCSNATSINGFEGCDPSFMRVARNILKRLFRVYAHMYHNHLQDYVALHADSHLNFCFKRFILFVRHFDLVEQKELNALRKLIQTLVVKAVVMTNV